MTVDFDMVDRLMLVVALRFLNVQFLIVERDISGYESHSSGATVKPVMLLWRALGMVDMVYTWTLDLVELLFV